MLLWLLHLGAIEIGVIASQPIPEFKDGHYEGTHEGLALLNDGGKDEYKMSKDGSISKIEGRNVLGYMEKGDKIYKSKQDLFKKVDMSQMVENHILKSQDHEKIININTGEVYKQDFSKMEKGQEKTNRLLNGIFNKPNHKPQRSIDSKLFHQLQKSKWQQ